MKIVYFYAKDGKKIGPLSKEQLDDLHLAPDTFVWHYGLTGWIPYKNLPKQVIKEDEESPFDKFCAWVKGKKNTTAKAETPAKPVVEKPVEQVAEKPIEQVAEKTQDPIAEKQEVVSQPAVEQAPVTQPVAQKSEDKSEKRQKTRHVLKKILISFLILVGMAGLSVGGYFAYDYCVEEYLPEKRQNKACADLEEKWENADEQEKLELAKKILTKQTDWGYDKVANNVIHTKFGARKRKEALKIIENAAFQGDGEIQLELGLMYVKKDSYFVESNPDKAAYWFREAASNRVMRGYTDLGICYEHGLGVKADKRKAFECYKIAADAGDDHGLYCLGCLYAEGVNDSRILLPKDTKKACELWKKAAAQGHEEAKSKLQKIYE